jgi:hypothetical protein
VLIFSLILSSSLVLKKFETPYSWWGYTTPSIYESTVPSTFGLTKGLKFSENDYINFQEIFERLNQLPCRGEVIGYPHMPIFALESNRFPEGKVAVYWYDFISEQSKFNELNRLKKAQISTFLIMDMPNVLEAHYKLFVRNKENLRNNLDEYIRLRSSLQGRTYYPNLNVFFSSC